MAALPFDIGIGGGMGSVLSGVIKIVFYALVGLFLIILIFFLGKIYRNKKSYNIPVTIWIPRSDNKIIDEIQARGGYFKSKAVGGITTFRLKRKKLSMVEIPPPASRFLVGLSRRLYLVQKGMDDFEPVLPESFMTVETSKINQETGKPIRKSVVNLKCVNQDATAWMFDNRENAEKRFTLKNFWDKYKDMIQITIFILIVFIAIYINYTGLKDVAAALAEVADKLVPPANVPVVS